MAWVDLRKRARSINARILNMERKYGKDSRIVQNVYKTVSKAYGYDGKSEIKKRFTIPSKELSLRELARIDRAMGVIEFSAYSSKENRKAMEQKARSTFANNQRNKSNDEPKYSLQAYDIFRELKSIITSEMSMASEQLLESIDITRDKFTKKDFNKIAEDYMSLLKNPSSDANNSIPNFFEYVLEKREEYEEFLKDDSLERHSKKQFFGR